MRSFLKTAMVFVVIVAGVTSVADAQVSIGISIGAPPAPRIVHTQPSRPGPNYVWIEGYWYPVANHYTWHNGYWTRPPYEGARWVGPRHEDGRFYVGYWNSERGRVEHDHHWDRNKGRDYDHGDHR
jgi:hypothetical protein